MPDELRIDFEMADVSVVEDINLFECCIQIISGAPTDVISIQILDMEEQAQSEMYINLLACFS